MRQLNQLLQTAVLLLILSVGGYFFWQYLQAEPTRQLVEPVYAQPTAVPDQPAVILQAPATFTPEPRPLAIEIIAPVGTTASHLGQGCKRDMPCPGVTP